MGAPESTADSRSSGLCEVGDGIPVASRSFKRSFVRILALVNIFAKFHATPRAYRSWCKVSSCDFPRILARQKYHPRENDYRCKSETISKTIDPHQITNITFFFNSKTINQHKITDVTDVADFYRGDRGRLTAVHISKHSLFRLKNTFGCRLCAYPSIHVETLKITLSIVHISKHSYKNLQTCWTPWSTQETRGLWARPPVLTPVPVQAFHSRACLNLHHSDIQGTAQKSPCVNTFLRPSQKKKRPSCLCLGTPGQDTQNKDTRDNGHVRQQRARCDMMQVAFFFGRHQRGPAPYTKRNGMQRSKFDIGRADAGVAGMSISSGSSCASGMGASSSSQSTGSSGAGSGSVCLEKSSSCASSVARLFESGHRCGHGRQRRCSQSVKDCASFVSSSRNSNRTTPRSSLQRPELQHVDTSKNKSANSGKRDDRTCDPPHNKKNDICNSKKYPTKDFFHCRFILIRKN